jgi:hypothetical protein
MAIQRIRPGLLLSAAVALGGLAALLPGCADNPAQAQGPQVDFSLAQIRIELNATDGDVGLQIQLDGEPWHNIEVTGPTGRVLRVDATGNLLLQGLTELFNESAEPPFSEFPLADFLARFPAGSYQFVGQAVDGSTLVGTAALTHAMPAGPEIVSPGEDEVLDTRFPVVIEWDEVTTLFPGSSGALNMAGYDVVVDRVEPLPKQRFTIELSASARKVTVPAEFIQRSALYQVEVLAKEAGGNQTITVLGFKTD